MESAPSFEFSQVKLQLQQLGKSSRGHLEGILLILKSLQKEDIQLPLPQILLKAIERIHAGLNLVALNTEVARMATENIVFEGLSPQQSNELLTLQYSVLMSVVQVWCKFNAFRERKE